MPTFRILTAMFLLLVLPVSGVLLALSGSLLAALFSGAVVLFWVFFQGIRAPRVIVDALGRGGPGCRPATPEIHALVRAARDRLEQAAWQHRASRQYGLSGLQIQTLVFENSRAIVFSVRNLVGSNLTLLLSTGAVMRLSEAALSEAISLAVLEANRPELGVRCWAAALATSILGRIPAQALGLVWDLQTGEVPHPGEIENQPQHRGRWIPNEFSPLSVLSTWAFLPLVSILLKEVEPDGPRAAREGHGELALGLNRLENGAGVGIERRLRARQGGAQGVPLALQGLVHGLE